MDYQQVLGVLTGHTTRVLVIHTDELALIVGYVLAVIQVFVTRSFRLFPLSNEHWSTYCFNGDVVTCHGVKK